MDTKILRNFVAYGFVVTALFPGLVQRAYAVEVGEPERWGGAEHVVPVKRLYIADQPDRVSLTHARDQGVGVVINLRGPGEIEWDEAAEVTALGLKYYNVPLLGPSMTLDHDAIAEMSNLLAKHPDEKVFIHCSSGNRAAAWLAAHFVADHGMSVEKSIALAEQAGLSKPELKALLLDYLDPSL